MLSKGLVLVLISMLIFGILNLIENLIHYNIGRSYENQYGNQYGRSYENQYNNVGFVFYIPTLSDFVKILLVMFIFGLAQGLLTEYFVQD